MKQKFLSLVAPQRVYCHYCGRYLPQDGYLCESCTQKLLDERLSPSDGSQRLPWLDGCMSLFEHDGFARNLVIRFKYKSDAFLANVFAPLLALCLCEPLPDIIIYVPMHPKHKKLRGYNQAELLARALHQCTGLPVGDDVLLSTRLKRSQVGLSRMDRLSTMLDTIFVIDPEQVKEKSVLLVDDVVTTGATAIACTRALKAAGAYEVRLLTVCKA